MNCLDLDYAFEVDRPRETAGWDAEGPQTVLGDREWAEKRETLERTHRTVYVAYADSSQARAIRGDVDALEDAGFDIMWNELQDGGITVRMYQA